MNAKLLTAALIVAGGALAGCADEPRRYYGPPPGEHVRWCFAHHPGYDPRSNLFPGPDGRLHVCRIPPPPPPGYYAPPPPAYGPPPPPPPPR